ncbi:MAG: TraR/DksA C4-type zinc finger protein [Deltaproteobacteria bacterium]
MDYLGKLNDKKDEIEKIIRHKQELLSHSLMETTDELSAYDQHPADSASETYEREKDHGLLELYELELEKVNDALERYQEGKYGICDTCGQPIEPRRLQRMVNTTLCYKCALERQDHFRGPAEEDITADHAMADRGEAFTIAGYDIYDE